MDRRSPFLLRRTCHSAVCMDKVGQIWPADLSGAVPNGGLRPYRSSRETDIQAIVLPVSCCALVAILIASATASAGTLNDNLCSGMESSGLWREIDSPLGWSRFHFF